MTNVNKLVASAAEFLDAKRPGWFNEIDLDSLYQNDDSRCVLGQLYSSYSRGLRELNPGGSVGRAFKWEDHEFHGLTGAWKSLIVSRRIQDKLFDNANNDSVTTKPNPYRDIVLAIEKHTGDILTVSQIVALADEIETLTR